MKTVKFEVRDIDNNVYKNMDFCVPSKQTYDEAVTLFTNFLKEHVNEPEQNIKSSAADIINEWLKTKQFPNGTFFFMKADKHPFFRVGYLYKVESV